MSGKPVVLVRFLTQKWVKEEELFKGTALFSDDQTREVWASHPGTHTIGGLEMFNTTTWYTSINGVTTQVS